jgi:hypothetical protein
MNSFRTPFRMHALIVFLAVCGYTIFPGMPDSAMAQGQYQLATVPTGSTSTSSNSFISFDITAHQAVRLHRFSNLFSGTASTIVDIWARPNGYTNANNGWIHVGRATVTPTSTTVPTEIPIDMDFLIAPTEKWGFIISHHTNSVKYNSSITQSSFSDSFITIDCGSHCAGTGTGDPTTGVTSFNFSLCPRQWVGVVSYDEGATAANDAGISSIESPKDFCAGQHDIDVTLQNFGINQITAVTINWQLNGVAQTAVNWTGLLDTLTAASRKTTVTLGTQTFQEGIPYTITAWTGMPNGVADTVTNNDTTSVTRRSAMAGTYTIGGASPDYATFAAALTDLHDNGLCGPVVFNVRSGTYNEQVAFGSGAYGSISGSSATNTVTFQSETGNRSDVTITYYSQTGNPTLYFNSTNYITFRNMTVTATNPSYSVVIWYQGGSQYLTFDNLELVGSVTTSTSTNNSVVYSPSGSLDHNTTFTNCGIRNGSYGMYLYGSGTASTEDNVLVQGCHFTGQYYRPLHAYYLGFFDFLDNTIEFTSTYSSKYIAYIYYGNNTNVERNVFFTGGTHTTNYGIYFAYQNRAVTGFSRFVNNFVTSQGGTSTSYAVRPYYCDDLLFAHNTITMNSSFGTSYTVYSYYGDRQEYINNIMIHTGAGRAWYVNPPTAITASDYNNLYATGPVLAYWNADRANLQALQMASGMDMNSVSKPVSFANESLGDLHLAFPSDDDNDLIGSMLSSVTDDIDHDPRVRPYMGADEACYLIPNSLVYDFVDGGGNPIGYAELPGTIGVHYTVIFPDFEATITMTVNFYSITDNQLQHSTSFSAHKAAGQTLDGTTYLTLPASLPQGYYRIEVVFNTKNSCGYYRDYMPYPSSLMLLEQGSYPCEVWPGDVNNDGVVNYADRKDLNEYIHEANLRTMWLNGPARFRADAAQNPLTYLEWQPQASAPWYTPEGCYMDTDGNGVINNFDYIAIKLNWMKKHGAVPPKQSDRFNPSTFDMSQNYPNPFNPSTTISYSVPERSRVQLRIVDMLGRDIRMAVNDVIETGVYHYVFDAGALPSGQYLAIVSMTGEASGLTFNKTIRMTLNK